MAGAYSLSDSHSIPWRSGLPRKKGSGRAGVDDPPRERAPAVTRSERELHAQPYLARVLEQVGVSVLGVRTPVLWCGEGVCVEAGEEGLVRDDDPVAVVRSRSRRGRRPCPYQTAASSTGQGSSGWRPMPMSHSVRIDRDRVDECGRLAAVGGIERRVFEPAAVRNSKPSRSDECALLRPRMFWVSSLRRLSRSDTRGHALCIRSRHEDLRHHACSPI